jgi:hypothetical protein
MADSCLWTGWASDPVREPGIAVIRPEQQFRNSHFGGMAMKLQSDLGLYRWK